MNFQTILEELDRLYDEPVEKELGDEKVIDEETMEEEQPEAEALTEASGDGEAEEVTAEETEPAGEEPVENTEEDAEESRLVLECANCGAVIIRAEADVKVDAESDLANVEEPCQYCEESAGYAILGVVAPYAAEEAVVEVVDDEATEDEVIEDEIVE